MNIHNSNPNQTLLAILGNVFDAHAALLFLPQEGSEGNEAKEGARLVSSWCPTQAIALNTFIESGKGYVGWMLRHQAPLLVPHQDLHSGSLGYYEGRSPDIKSFLGCPIEGGGVIVVDSLQIDAFSEDMQKLLSLFARLAPQIQSITQSNSLGNEISTYFHAVEGLAALRQSYTTWTEYVKACLVIIAQATGFEYTAFASRPEDAKHYLVESENVPLIMETNTPVELPMQSGMVGWVLRNEESIYNDGNDAVPSTPLYGKIKGIPDFPSTICIPIQVDKTTCATLCLASRTTHTITPELRSFIRMAADDMAQLLERITLRHKIRTLIPRSHIMN